MKKRTILIWLLVVLAIVPCLKGAEQRMGLLGLTLYMMGLLTAVVLAGQLLWEAWKKA